MVAVPFYLAGPYMRYIENVGLFMFLEKCVIRSSDEPVDAGSEI